MHRVAVSCFLGPARVHTPNDISIGSAVFAGLTIVTDRQTDRPTDHAIPSVPIGRIYIVLRCGLIATYIFLSRHKMVTIEEDQAV